MVHIERALAHRSPEVRRVAVNLVARMKRLRLASYRPWGAGDADAAEELERAGLLVRVGPMAFALPAKAKAAGTIRYTGISSHESLPHYSLYDTVVAKE